MKKIFRAGLRGYKCLTDARALFLALREYFAHPISLRDAEDVVKRNVAARGENFLDLVRTRVYERPGSPYLTLLKIAGCEFSDLEAAVRRDGLERTLTALAREGVYLSADEFKGKKNIVRRGRSFRVSPADFDRPDALPGFTGQSSGTSNRPVSSTVSLDWLAATACARSVFFRAHDLVAAPQALYDSMLPGMGAINNLLIGAKIGKTAERWFVHKIPYKSRLSNLYSSLLTHEIVLAANRFGPGFPKPETGDCPEDRIVDWIVGQRRSGRSCFITTLPNHAARICRAASDRGASLAGAKFYVGGEPFTEAKEAAIEKTGATSTSRYSYGGALTVGYGCPNPLERDEVHITQDIFAMIDHPDPIAHGPQLIHPLLLTTLHAAAPRLLLNVANGDYAVLSERKCGCAMEAAGFALHVHRIRSYEKFTSEGMNYFYGDLFELMEKTFPAEFGGAVGDYQLVEEEDRNGQTRLSLRVQPDIPNLDEARLLRRLHEELGKEHWANQFQMRVWREAGTLRIRREAPHMSLRGKILPLHIDRGQR
ncbi:MAG TPA: hypothetical protein VGH50_11065 [Candidatus Binatia bacterium]